MMVDKPEQEQNTEETQDEEEPRSQQTRIDWSKLEDLGEEKKDDDSDEYELNQYKQITHLYNNEEGGADGVTKEPYIIAPYDFGELDGYHTI
jgi:hypothetical protein